MIGAIAGDIIGSVYEYRQIKTKEFPLFHRRCHFTDDSVLTVAVAEAILTDGDYRKAVLQIGRRYPHAGYGSAFAQWLRSPNPKPYNSWGNGSAMRASPVGFAFGTADEVLREAARSAEFTHNHPEGIKGAQATALAVFLARTAPIAHTARAAHDKELIRQEIASRFGYDLARTVDEIRSSYRFNESCQGTVPEAIVAFLDSTSYEDAVRNAVSLGGDSDTLACITGGIAEAFYGPVLPAIRRKVQEILTPELWEITERFSQAHKLG
jgi:ADP-ribosylglycohydrolase